MKWNALAIPLVLLGLARPAAATVWPSSHQRVAEALESGDTTERRRAASQLMTLPPKLARGLAQRALRDVDTEVRIFAARAAAALGVPRAGDEVVSWLQDRDVRLRVAACEVIEASPTPNSVQSLARVLGDAQAEVRRAAAAAMGGSGMEDAVSPLLGHLDDGSQAVRLEVVRALGRIGDLRAVVPLVSKLQDQEADVRREAARALGQLGDARATATLMLALQDKALVVRVQALQSLGRLRAGEAVSAIAALLSGDADGASGEARGPVREAALRALGQIGNEQAVRILVAALEQEGPVPLESAHAAPVREALALAGGAAKEALVKALAGSSRSLASGAALALARIRADSALEEIVHATQRGAVSMEAGLTALGALRDGRALPFVLEQLEHGDAVVRKHAVQVATLLLSPESRDGRAVDVVDDRVRDLTTPLGERMALVRLLGKTGSPRAQKLLLSLAETKPMALRVAVIEALGSLGETSPQVDAALLGALEDHNPRLRMAAARAIGRVGRDAAARELLHRLDVSAEQDRGAIGIGLSGALSRSSDPKLAARVKQALASVPASARDALIEGLGRMQGDAAAPLLATLAKHPDPDDRRKVAEALAGQKRGEPPLLGLLADADPAVRANAAWSLGTVGQPASLAPLVEAVGDLDVGVAGNAAVSLARVAKRSKQTDKAVAALCAALGDYRAYVRAGALAGLRILGARCEGGTVRHLLLHDDSWRVRLAAAQLLRQSDDTLDRRALWRCAVEDRDATVARRCEREPSAAPRAPASHDVMVYVVPDGKTAPEPRAPFALVLPDGRMRLGVADRRGALLEHDAPAGDLALAVPAALAD